MPDTSNPRRCDNAAARRRQAEGIATPSSQQGFARDPLPGPARRQAFVLIGATIAVAFTEAGPGLAIDLRTSSVAITGLGLDSAIKVVAALVLLWELGGRRDAAQERRALHLLALAFFAVAAYVAVASSEELAAAREPDTTPGGLIATAIAALALPLLIVGKRRLARRTGSLTLWSDVDKTRLLRIAGVGSARVGGTQRGAWLVVDGSSRRARDAGLRCGRDSRIWTRRARSPVTGRYLARAAGAHPEAPGRRAGCAAAQPASAPAYTCRASALLAPRLSIT